MAGLATQLADAVLGQYQAGVPDRILIMGQSLLLNAGAAAIIGREQLDRGWLPDADALTGNRSPGRAAARFAMAAHACGFDDGHVETLTHPGSVNIGAALGIASLADVSGRDFLTAFLLGCETGIRLARALAPESLAQGWDLNGISGTLSATVTAALLLGASADMLGNAVGMGASCTLGQLSSVGSMLESYVVGKASANGVSCALLSRGGFTASPGALDAPRGLGAALVQDPGVFSAVTDNLGAEWLLDELIINRYPCAIFLQPVVDAVLKLRAASVEESQRSAPIVLCSDLAAQLGSRPFPADGREAQASVQHCAATALREGGVSLEHFTDEYTAAMAATTGAVRIEVNGRLSLRQAEALIEPASGEAAERHEVRVHRSREYGLPAAEVPTRARVILGSQRQEGLADSLIALTSDLAEQPNVHRLLTAMIGAAA
jgi:2-methylcitrate dehydratase PrpD